MPYTAVWRLEGGCKVEYFLPRAETELRGVQAVTHRYRYAMARIKAIKHRHTARQSRWYTSPLYPAADDDHRNGSKGQDEQCIKHRRNYPR
jgi:hypothetical protein